MNDKVRDDDLRWIVQNKAQADRIYMAYMAAELLTLRRREREARELIELGDASSDQHARHEEWVFRVDKWLSEGAEHE